MSQTLQEKQRLIPVADTFREKQSELSVMEKKSVSYSKKSNNWQISN
ncbi:hypothetical protein SNF32_07945 [Enterococcus mundtii]|nr:hypothetical protein [Enterococcus mundtii]